jgi:predicted RNA-binding Zn-ribbon protein involved in translation (DUF1610 family)
MRTFRPGTTRDVVLIVIAVILLVVAGSYMALRGSGEDAAPDDQYLSFRCEACGESFRLSHREFEKLTDERRFATKEDGRTLVYECPKCKEIRAVRVADEQTRGAAPTEP